MDHAWRIHQEGRCDTRSLGSVVPVGPSLSSSIHPTNEVLIERHCDGRGHLSPCMEVLSAPASAATRGTPVATPVTGGNHIAQPGIVRRRRYVVLIGRQVSSMVRVFGNECVLGARYQSARLLSKA